MRQSASQPPAHSPGMADAERSSGCQPPLGVWAWRRAGPSRRDGQLPRAQDRRHRPGRFAPMRDRVLLGRAPLAERPATGRFRLRLEDRVVAEPVGPLRRRRDPAASGAPNRRHRDIAPGARARPARARTRIARRAARAPAPRARRGASRCSPRRWRARRRSAGCGRRAHRRARPPRAPSRRRASACPAAPRSRAP